MKYKILDSPSNIRSIVQFFWEFEGGFSNATSYQHAMSASVCPKLAFQFEGSMNLIQNGK